MAHEYVAVSCVGLLERLAGTLRLWIGSKECMEIGLDREAGHRLVKRCLSVTKWAVSMDNNGYESMSDEPADAEER